MYRDQTQLDEAIAEAVDLDRRTVSRAMAWSVPVVMAAVAAPAATGSQPTPTPVLPTGVILTPGNKGSVAIDFGKGDANVTVTLTAVTGGGATWAPESGGKVTTSTATTTSKLTFTVAQNSSGNLNGTVTVRFSLSSGSNWEATFSYSNAKEAQTATPATY
jgi:hypothetical protein